MIWSKNIVQNKPKENEMNLNVLAKQVKALEGKKKKITIAQVKEVLRCLAALEAAYKIKAEAFYLAEPLLAMNAYAASIVKTSNIQKFKVVAVK